jgi:LacI family transcriptional regulator
MRALPTISLQSDTVITICPERAKLNYLSESAPKPPKNHLIMTLTLEDIARLTGCSRSTVSRVINGDANVSESTRQKVKKVIAELNFQPNLAARGLASGQTHILGLIVPLSVTSIFSDPFYPQLIQSVSKTSSQRDYSIMLWLASPEFERRTIHQVLYNGLIDGVIVSAMPLNDSIIQSLAKSNLPFATIGRNPNDDKTCFIDVDNYNGAREAVDHLYKMGRRRIATIAGPGNVIVGFDRLRGYKDAILEHGLEYDPDLVVEGDFSDAGGYIAALKLINKHPDGIFATSDVMAVAAIRALVEAGLKVPEDVAIVGFDDISLASRSVPALTTIRQPIELMGASVVNMLIDLIEHPSTATRSLVLPTELVIRSSCGEDLVKETRQAA